MFRWSTLLLVFSLALPRAQAQARDEFASQSQSIARLDRQRATLGKTTAALATTFRQRNTAIASLKKQRASWNRDRKLKALLAHAKQMAGALDARQRHLRNLDRRVVQQRRALITLLEKKLRSTASLADTKRWRALRSAHLRKLPNQRRKLKLAAVTIDPLDDPEDLDEKATILQRNERELARETQRLIARATYYSRRAKLESSQRRSDALEVFREDQPRRRTGRGAGTNPTGVGTGPNNNPGGPPTDQEDPGGFLDPNRDNTASAPSVFYADVIFPGTLTQFRRAEASGDPRELARAARRAAKDLQRRVEAMRLRRTKIERRAQWLRRGNK